MAMIPSSRQEHDRQQRRAGAEQTMAVCEAGGYILEASLEYFGIRGRVLNL